MAKQTSFKGVPFVEVSTNKGGGNRVVVHQYPRSNKQRNEILGNSVNTFTISCKVVGEDASVQRDKLEAVLKETTPGILIHSSYGEILVVVDSYSIRDGYPKAFVSFFTITFNCEISTDTGIVVKEDYGRKVELASQVLVTSTQVQAANNYTLEKQTKKGVTDVRETLDLSFQKMQAVKKSVATSAAYKQKIETARGQLIALSLNAVAIANTYYDLLFYFEIDADEVFTDLDRFKELDIIYRSTLTPMVNIDATNAYDNTYPARQVQLILGLTVVAAMLQYLPAIEFNSYDDAASTQLLLFEYIDRLQNEATLDDEVYEALQDCRYTVYNFFDKNTLKLPRIVNYRLAQNDNILAMTYRIYGDLKHVEDTLFLNEDNIFHPGFVPKGIDLKIKSE